MPVWSVASVGDQPEIILCRWKVIETERREHHFVGLSVASNTGRVSSATLEIPRATMVLEEANPSAGSTSIADIRKDRELMTHFRKAMPSGFDRLTKMLGEMHKDGLPMAKLDYELVAIGCSTITQCAYCMERHVVAAKALGVEDSQVAQVIHLAVSARVEASFLAADVIL